MGKITCIWLGTKVNLVYYFAWLWCFGVARPNDARSVFRFVNRIWFVAFFLASCFTFYALIITPHSDTLTTLAYWCHYNY